MNNRWLLLLLISLAGCQFNETLPADSLSGGPSLRAFPEGEGIYLVWNSYILPYYPSPNQSSEEPGRYHVLASETGPHELSRIAEVDGNTHQFSTGGESVYWFAVEAEYENGSTARSNIVMSSSSSALIAPVPIPEPLSFSADYSELTSGIPLFQQMNLQSTSEIGTLNASGSRTTLIPGRSPSPHPFLNQFLYISDPDNLGSNPSSSNSLLLWDLTDSTVTPLVVGAGYVDKPSFDREGNRIVYLSSAGPGEPTTTRIINLDSNSVPTGISSSPIDRYSGGGIEGPNFASFFPGRPALVMDVPSIDNGAIGRNILLKSIDGGTDSLLIQSPWVDTQPAIHPNGKSMMFVSDRSGSPAIWEMELGSGNLRQLSGSLVDPVASRAYPLHWSHDGEVLWFTGISDGKISSFRVEK